MRNLFSRCFGVASQTPVALSPHGLLPTSACARHAMPIRGSRLCLQAPVTRKHRQRIRSVIFLAWPISLHAWMSGMEHVAGCCIGWTASCLHGSWELCAEIARSLRICQNSLQFLAMPVVFQQLEDARGLAGVAYKHAKLVAACATMRMVSRWLRSWHRPA